MDGIAIFYPAFVLVFWTLVVLLMVGRRRFRAAHAGQVHARDFAYGESANVPGEVLLPSRNYSNLLELPVLFHTPALRDRWEQAARHNLTAELRALEHARAPYGL